MKAIDLKSVLIAGAIGALVMTLIQTFSSDSTQPLGYTIGTGFVVGAAVQIGVRLTGVS